MMNGATRYLQVAIYAARKAGNFVREQQKRPLTITNKGYRDWVTDVDLASQKMIIETIREEFPDHHFLGEEGELSDANLQIDEQPVWIIDPLDGTSNYSRRLSNFAVSIALAINGQVQVGVVFDPVHDEIFTAVSGQGSRCNGELIHRNGRVSHLSDAIFALDWGRSHEQRQQTIAVFQNLLHKVRTIRSIGSAALALCWIADGRLDAYLNFNMKVWDVAAAGLIASEAGAHVSAPGGSKWQLNEQTSWSLCSAPAIHAEIISQIEHVVLPELR